MTIQVVSFKHLSVDEAGNLIEEDAMFVAVIGNSETSSLKKLVQQGSNLEPNLSPAMKELADLVTNGVVLQNYRGRSE